MIIDIRLRLTDCLKNNEHVVFTLLLLRQRNTVITIAQCHCQGVTPMIITVNVGLQNLCPTDREFTDRRCAEQVKNDSYISITESKTSEWANMTTP